MNKKIGEISSPSSSLNLHTISYFDYFAWRKQSSYPNGEIDDATTDLEKSPNKILTCFPFLIRVRAMRAHLRNEEQFLALLFHTLLLIFIKIFKHFNKPIQKSKKNFGK